jgi:plastocyanin
VGVGGALRFNPTEIDANIGDVIEFTFLKLNHTLTQSTLFHPCSNVGGFSTGFNQFNPMNDAGKFVVKYPVTTSGPQWFFCAQTQGKSHCQAGMVFALNAGDKMGAFQSAASVTSSLDQSGMFTTSTTLISNTEDPVTWTVESSTSNTTERPGMPTTSSTSVANFFTENTAEQPSALSLSTSQMISPTPKYQNSTAPTSPRTALPAPTPAVSIAPTPSMGTRGEVAALVSLALLTVTMLMFMSL